MFLGFSASWGLPFHIPRFAIAGAIPASMGPFELGLTYAERR